MSVFSRFLVTGWITACVVFATCTLTFAQEEMHHDQAHAEASHEAAEFNVSEVILDHVKDAYTWHFWEGHYGTLYLPVILYSAENGLEIFSSSNFYDDHHNHVAYKGYQIEGNKIISVATGQPVSLDLSITKNVLMLFINAGLLLLIFLGVAKGARKNAGAAPKGIQSFFEPIILFVKDEIVKPNIGAGYEKYLPYMLTLFFFVLFGNLLGLLPGAANLTGNIAVTLVLAVLTFIITNVNGNRYYWSHIFWTPGVPMVLRPIILMVELIGIFTKPFALMIRLFAAITAGHIVILSLLCMAFLFHSWAVGVGSSIFVMLINLIELLVAGIQAYVFTLFSSLYIGMATEHGHEHEH